MITFQLFMVAVLLGCVLMLYRNRQVFEFRTDLLHHVSALSKQDVHAGREWWWRYVELEKVTYGDMMIRFWVPLEPENFWEDLAFLEDPDEESETVVE